MYILAALLDTMAICAQLDDSTAQALLGLIPFMNVQRQYETSQGKFDGGSNDCACT